MGLNLFDAKDPNDIIGTIFLSCKKNQFIQCMKNIITSLVYSFKKMSSSIFITHPLAPLWASLDPSLNQFCKHLGKTWNSNISVNTSEAVSVMPSVWFGESRLIAKMINSLDTRFRSPTPFTRGHNRVANTSISKPARTAVVQTIIPGGIQLSSGG